MEKETESQAKKILACAPIKLVRIWRKCDAPKIVLVGKHYKKCAECHRKKSS